MLSNYANAKIIKWATNYAVTSCGKVLSLRKNIKEIKPNLSSCNQYKICICVNGVRHTVYLKNLVAEYFLPKPKGLNNLVLWHLDENKHNNAASNLVWVEFKTLCILTNSKEYAERIKFTKKLKNK